MFLLVDISLTNAGVLSDKHLIYIEYFFRLKLEMSIFSVLNLKVTMLTHLSTSLLIAWRGMPCDCTFVLCWNEHSRTIFSEDGPGFCCVHTCIYLWLLCLKTWWYFIAISFRLDIFVETCTSRDNIAMHFIIYVHKFNTVLKMLTWKTYAERNWI